MGWLILIFLGLLALAVVVHLWWLFLAAFILAFIVLCWKIILAVVGVIALIIAVLAYLGRDSIAEEFRKAEDEE